MKIAIIFLISLSLNPFCFASDLQENSIKTWSQETETVELSKDTAKQIKDRIEMLRVNTKQTDSQITPKMFFRRQQIKGMREVEPLINALNDEDTYVRILAATALGEIQDARSVEPLITLLADNSSGVREAAATALGKLKDAKAVEPLIVTLKDPYYDDVSEAAIIALTKIGAPALQPLITTLEDPNLKVQRNAATALAGIQNIPSVDKLTTALKNDDLMVIAGVYPYFIRKGIKGSEGPLIKSLNKYGDGIMAEDFLNCGNSILEEAALKWLQENEYDIFTTYKKEYTGIRWEK